MSRRTLLATLSLALLLALPAGVLAGASSEGYLPVASHAPGAFGSSWTTDVWIYRQDATVVHLWLNLPGRDNTEVGSVPITLDRDVVKLADIVASVFGTEGTGSIHYLADAPIEVVSRTWTPAPGGDGTFGQLIRGIPIGDASAPSLGQAGALRMVVDARAGFRANLGLANVSNQSVTVEVRVFGADGAAVTGFTPLTVDLAPYGWTQLNDVLASLSAEDGLVVRAAVTSASGAIVG